MGVWDDSRTKKAPGGCGRRGGLWEDEPEKDWALWVRAGRRPALFRGDGASYFFSFFKPAKRMSPDLA